MHTCAWSCFASATTSVYAFRSASPVMTSVSSMSMKIALIRPSWCDMASIGKSCLNLRSVQFRLMARNDHPWILGLDAGLHHPFWTPPILHLPQGNATTLKLQRRHFPGTILVHAAFGESQPESVLEASAWSSDAEVADLLTYMFYSC